MSSDSVKKGSRKVERRETLSPILLVRDGRNDKLAIAEACHREGVMNLFSDES
jgi:hypothetical protein